MNKYNRILLSILLPLMIEIPAVQAHDGMHGGGLIAPADPSLSSSLISNSHLIVWAPLPPHQQPTRSEDPSSIVDLKPTSPELRLDQQLAICRGC